MIARHAFLGGSLSHIAELLKLLTRKNNRAPAAASPEGTSFFDSDWYIAHYPDVEASGMDPYTHYLSHGAGEGRNPSPYFDTEWYVSQNPDLADSGMNPLEHYIRYGKEQGRTPRKPRLDELTPLPKSSETPTARVLVLTPVKDCQYHATGYFERLNALSYPHDLISVGILESDSKDDTFSAFQAACQRNRKYFSRVEIWSRHFDYQIPKGIDKREQSVQLRRREVLARSRNQLLFRALRDEDWVLWLDADVIEYPPDIIERLLFYKKDIVHPHCVTSYGGPSFDRNAWLENGRLCMESRRGGAELVRLEAVGGTMLLVRADCHRDGLIFPPFLYGKRSPLVRRRADMEFPEEAGEIETEGLGIMAADMKLECWGIPDLEIIHEKY